MKQRASTVSHGAGFWIVAVAFLIAMAYTTVPTPLYPLYQERDGFPTSMITVIFAVYAIGVILSLYLVGHLSDTFGRRRMLVIALLISALSAVLFLVWSDVPGLIVARLVNGVSIGIVTATATAYINELRAHARPEANSVFATSVSSAANLGGLALGPLVGGIFAEYLPDPLVVPHAVFLILLLVLTVALLFVPETVKLPEHRPPYRPQRISIPASARGQFLAAAAGVFSGFAVFGLFTALDPTFLTTTFDVNNLLIAGLSSFAVFAAAATGQVALASVKVRIQLAIAVIACGTGLVLVAIGVLAPQIAVFVVGGAVAGLGVGLLFKGAIATTVAVSEPERKGESLALIFLIAYAGLAIPVLLVGFFLTFASATSVLLVFLAIVFIATVTAGTLMQRRTTEK